MANYLTYANLARKAFIDYFSDPCIKDEISLDDIMVRGCKKCGDQYVFILSIQTFLKRFSINPYINARISITEGKK